MTKPKTIKAEDWGSKPWSEAERHQFAQLLSQCVLDGVAASRAANEAPYNYDYTPQRDDDMGFHLIRKNGAFPKIKKTDIIDQTICSDGS